MKPGHFIRIVLRLLGSLLVCLAGAAVSIAQENKATPQIEIVKIHWEKQVRLPRNYDPSVINTYGSFPDPASRVTTAPGPGDTSVDMTSRRAALTAAGAKGAPSGPPSEYPNTPGRFPVFYVYSMKLKNTGTKTIRAVAWDYLFLLSTTKAVVGSHELFNYDKIKPGNTITLNNAQRRRPISTIQADNGKPPETTQRAIIECMIYEDNSVWKSSTAREGVCDLLRSKAPAEPERRQRAQDNKNRFIGN